MEKLRLIGDIHGQFDIWKNELIAGCDRSVQVGDFGIGFPLSGPDDDGIFETTTYPSDVDSSKHRFIRGNHDDPSKCKTLPAYIADGHTERIGTTRIMYIGGALSIDKAYRIPGLSWWEDEELSYPKLDRMIDIYCSWKPDLLITHECPEFISDTVLRSINRTKFNMQSRTRNAFQLMFDEYKPSAWYFGHWHNTYQNEHFGTYFRCLNINEWEEFSL